jgi:exopolyphosphatase/guanosine-5'-triphosphate,3'-diphosphate pyrophosphatase
MTLVKHPVHMVHGYTLSRSDAVALAERLRGPEARSLAKEADVAERRIDLVPRAAEVLELLLERMRPAQVEFSATGLREGYLYGRLDARERAKDPLLAAAATLSDREARNPAFCERLIPWSKRLFPRESAAAERLRRAACLLSDLGWREHPDYRAVQVFLRVLRFPFLGIDHEERVRLAASIFAAAGGKVGKSAPSPALELLDPAARRRAQTVGGALRLAYVVSGGAVPVLADSALTARGSRLTLSLRRRALPVSPNVETAFQRLLRAGGYAGGRIIPIP